MKKIAIVAGLVAAFLLVSCAPAKPAEKYGDMKEAMLKMGESYTAFGAALDKATTADEVVVAIDAFIKDSTAHAEVFKKMEEKYPEFKTATAPPAELTDAYAKLQEASASLSAPMEKLQQFATDTKVMEALQRMAQVSL